MPIGTILPYVGNLSDIPNGWHLCDGTDGTPNLLDNRFLEGAAIPGIYKEPGLPNIKGKGVFGPERGNVYSGAFKFLGSGFGSYETGRQDGYHMLPIFSASYSNPIYGAAETVQPKSYTVLYIIKIKQSFASQETGTGGEAVGTIVPRLTSTFASVQEKGCYLYCDGSVFPIASYPKLYAVLGTNVLPDLRNRFLQGNDIGNQEIEAGLPNITGVVDTSSTLTSYSYGALSGVIEPGNGGNAININGLGAIFFNAESRRKYWHQQTYGETPSDVIYGNSITVQPPAVTVRYYIRAK